MKKIYLFIVAILAFSFAQAQYVTIPDANFAAWLNANIPSAMNGNQMDTTSTAVTTLQSISVQNKGIADLTGLQYFTSLKKLDCGNISNAPNQNTLTTLPPLPNSLNYLLCKNNQLTSLPALPDSLNGLWCDNNQLSSLPSLPNSLVDLVCSNNFLTNLPILPNSLMDLICDQNQLTILPVLPNSLTYLYFSHNSITYLPSVPIFINTLGCYNNQLSSLPFLPNTLKHLFCSSNYLTNLPFLPDSLEALVCVNNNIHCFPKFPNTLINPNGFDIFGNPFTCLPNYVPAMDAATLNYPLCLPNDTNNLNGCTNSFHGILGFANTDNNNNCIKDSGDANIKNVHALLYDSNNNLIAQTFTAINGIYDFPDSIGIYTVRIDTANMPFKVQCNYPGVDSTLTLTAVNPLADHVNFSFNCKPGFDLGVQSLVHSGMVFPGQQHRISIVAGDLSHWYHLNCASGISGQVQISVGGPVAFHSITPGALTPSIAGNVYTYPIADFGQINNAQAFGLVFTTDTTAQAGDMICVDISVSPFAGDNDTINNAYHYCYTVINSYDPNMKEVYPTDVLPGYNDYFTYTLHFQNTGNAAAQNIRLLDTLSTNLDMATFQVTNYSHYNIVSLKNNILTVRFPNIQLPDSFINAETSKGFIQYRIKPKTNLPLGTLIKNKAHIYFDYNAPVVTNTTSNEYVQTLAVRTYSVNPQISIYPIPATNSLTIENKGKAQQNCTLTIRNTQSQEVLRVQVNIVNRYSLNLSHLCNGVYILSVQNNEMNYVSKIVIQK